MFSLGKTIFLFYLLILQLLEGRKTYFQTRGGTVYFIDDMGVRELSDIVNSNEATVALVDADSEITTPHEWLSDCIRTQTILTSSPKPDSKFTWMKHSDNATRKIYVMDLWTSQELLAA